MKWCKVYVKQLVYGRMFITVVRVEVVLISMFDDGCYIRVADCDIN